MSASNPSTRSAVWAESGQTTVPSQGEQQSGFTAGKPSRRKFNWMTNWLDNAVQWLLTRGLPTYASDATYSAGSRVLDSSGKSWRCLQNGTTNVTPAEGAYWTAWGHTDDDVTSIASEVAGNVADAKIGTLSGELTTGTITSSNANCEVSYMWAARSPGTDVKQVFCRLTFADALGTQFGTTLTFSGGAAFDTGADNSIACNATEVPVGSPPATTVRARVTGNQTVQVTVQEASPSAATIVTVMVQGH